MIKYIVRLFVLIGLVLGLNGQSYAQNPQTTVSVNVNNHAVNFPDAAPYLDLNSNRVLVPIRFVAEQLGSDVSWDSSSQQVTMVKGSKTIKLIIGQTQANVNDEVKTFDTKAVIRDSRTYVPFRFISETFGSKVAWDANSRTVDITQASVADRNNMYSTAPEMNIDQSQPYFAEIKTNLGTFKVQLFAKNAPKTVNNFIFLSKDGFYDDITFHRIIKDFVIQAGDPLGDGTGGPGYQIPDELSSNIPYEKGILAMANAGPNTNGSQFFICTGDESKQLNNDPNYTIFGKVVAGMDVIDKIADTPVGPSPTGELSKPQVDVKIESIAIEQQ